jgi:hypothetical protein
MPFGFYKHLALEGDGKNRKLKALAPSLCRQAILSPLRHLFRIIEHNSKKCLYLQRFP